MVDPELVAIGAEALARLTDLGVMPEPGREGEEPQPDAGAQARECAGAVALEAELSLAGPKDRFDPLAHAPERSELERLVLEGEAGVGKTEAAKATAAALGARVIRLQCYEGLDVAHAVYEWNYARQLLHIRAAQAGTVDESELFGPEFLIRRPLLEAVEADEPVVLLIDEIDRADEEFEAFLLELLSDFQITIPELGTVHAERRPYVILTSNRTRDLHDALK